MTRAPARAIVVDPRTSRRYGFDRDSRGFHLLSSDDGGLTWSEIPAVVLGPSPGQNVKNSTKFVTARSEDGGETWTTIAPYAVDIVSDLRDAGTVYLVATNFPGESFGVFYNVLRSRDKGQTFESLDQGLPPNSARVLAIDSNGAFLHVGTARPGGEGPRVEGPGPAGRGVWELRLSSRGRPARR